MRNKVFIATSLDGYIADENGEIDWLTEIPNSSGHDGGFARFMESIDAIVMGRTSFEKVLSFGIEWPYPKQVFVWTNTLDQVPPELHGKVEFVRGGIKEVVSLVQQKSFFSLYIDGGKTIQSFLKENLIHEIIVTRVPILLGRGIPLFKDVPRLRLRHQSTQIFENGMVQSHYLVEA
jgi:dihydrofolate reductase